MDDTGFAVGGAADPYVCAVAGGEGGGDGEAEKMMAKRVKGGGGAMSQGDVVGTTGEICMISRVRSDTKADDASRACNLHLPKSDSQ